MLVKLVLKVLEKFRRGWYNDKELKLWEELLDYFVIFLDEILRMIEGEYMKCVIVLGLLLK